MLLKNSFLCVLQARQTGNNVSLVLFEEPWY